jgi:hypothetical protein
MSQAIVFQVISSKPTDFLHELNSPDILRSQLMPPGATIELRRQQIAKLQESISVLTAKREEFQRKMEDYITSLQELIRGLERSILSEIEKSGAAEGSSLPDAAIHVRCLRCETEKVFAELQIIFAKESTESLSLPTEMYVLEGGSLKKGHFRCECCGTDNLVIQSRRAVDGPEAATV